MSPLGEFSRQPLGARLSCYFYILFSSRTLQNSRVEALCLWKTFARGKIKSVRKSSEKKPDAKKKERVPLCQVKKKNPLWKRLVLAELSRWLPDFEQRSRCQSKIWRTWCWKRGYLFFMQVPALIQKHQQLPRIVILKLYVDLLSCSSAHFAGFPFLPRVFPLPLATLLVIVTSSSTLHWAIEIKKKCLKWVTFPGKSWSVVIDARRSYRPIGLRFQEAR